MLEFLDAKGVFSRDPLDFKDKDKDRIDDRLEGGGYSGNDQPESGGVK
jgi:ribosome assembly protein YihI (activator of Der GTPase)